MAKGNQLRVIIGTGVLNWNRDERQTDRWGAVKLFSDDLTFDGLSLSGKEHSGKRGKLIAIVKEARENLYNRVPKNEEILKLVKPVPKAKVGQKIVLGEGTLFFEVDQEDKADMVGLKPDDDRVENWLKPRALKRALSQTVDLFFEVI